MQRVLIVLLLSMTLLAAITARFAEASDEPGASPEPSVLRQETVDDNDDTRVEVQLTVLAIILCVVVGLGVPLYLLRKKLGLVPPPPGEDATGAQH
jgi:hypothetical protein